MQTGTLTRPYAVSHWPRQSVPAVLPHWPAICSGPLYGRPSIFIHGDSLDIGVLFRQVPAKIFGVVPIQPQLQLADGEGSVGFELASTPVPQRQGTLTPLAKL